MANLPPGALVAGLQFYYDQNMNLCAMDVQTGRTFIVNLPPATVTDAPSDGNSYVRQNGLWVPLGNAAAAPSQTFIITTTGQGTWPKPANAKWIKAIVIGDGGGGGSGRRSASGTAASGGYGGGGGAWSFWEGPASIVPALCYYQVGQGGTGGAPVSASDTNGNPGVAAQYSGSWWGAPTNVIGGALCSAQGGYPGPGGTTLIGGAAGTSAGVFPGGQMGAGSLTAAPALAPYVGITGTVVNYIGLGGGGGGCGGPVSTAAAAFAGGGGSPGAIGARQNTSPLWGAAGAIGANGGTPTDNNAASLLAGLGGGGGGSSVTAGVNAGNGGNGSSYGGGAGGGGAALDTAGNSGQGGNGAPGLLIILVLC